MIRRKYQRLLAAARRHQELRLALADLVIDAERRIREAEEADG